MMNQSLFYGELVLIASESFIEVMINGYLSHFQRADDLLAEKLSKIYGLCCVILFIFAMSVKKNEEEFLITKDKKEIKNDEQEIKND